MPCALLIIIALGALSPDGVRGTEAVREFAAPTTYEPNNLPDQRAEKPEAESHRPPEGLLSPQEFAEWQRKSYEKWQRQYGHAAPASFQPPRNSGASAGARGGRDYRAYQRLREELRDVRTNMRTAILNHVNHKVVDGKFPYIDENSGRQRMLTLQNVLTSEIEKVDATGLYRAPVDFIDDGKRVRLDFVVDLASDHWDVVAIELPR